MADTESVDQFDVPHAGLIYNIRKPSKVVAGLGVTIFLLLTLTITFIVLYATENEHPSTDTCSSSACVVSSSDILQNLDTSVKPCDDFYQFSCGGFLKNREIRDEQRSLTSFTIVKNDIDHLLNQLLEDEELVLNYSKDPNSAVHKALSFYKSCMNESAIEATGIKPMVDVIVKYLNVTNQTGIVSNDSWILERVLARAYAHLGTSALISVDVTKSFFDNSQYVIFVSAGSSGFDRRLDKKLSLSEEPKARVIQGYKKFMSTVFQLLGASPGKLLEENVNNIFKLEYSLKKLKRSWVEEGTKVGYKKVLKSMTLNELNHLSSFKFNWTVYFEEMVDGTNKSIPLNEKLMLVALPNDIKKIIDVLHQQPKSLLADAIMWNVVRGLIYTLPKSFREAENEYLQIITGLETEKPRWRICGDRTNTMFNYATALLFVNKYFSEDARKRAGDVFFEIKEQFVNGLEEQTWMDEKTRRAARAKLRAMYQTIGYPSFIKVPASLNKVYERYRVSPFHLFQNQLNIFKAWTLEAIDRFSKPGEIDLFGKPADHTRFPLSLIGANAFYDPQSNAMTVLMGILQNPFYESDRLKALNYGAIGMIIGHEITHGFDVSGSQYDAKGNLRPWWTKKSQRNFVKRSLCLAKKYNNTMVFGRKVDGVKTLSENIADNGGLKYAFRAYRKWRERNGEEDKLPALAYNNDQLFFIGFAQTWCSKYREEYIDALMLLDTHSLHPVRVRVPLSNFPEFSKAFGCKPPNTICTVW